MGFVIITRQFGIMGHDSQLAGRTEKVQGGIPDRNNEGRSRAAIVSEASACNSRALYYR